MRILPVALLVSSALLAGCAITGPEYCTPASTTTGVRGTLSDTSGTPLGYATLIMQSVEGDSVPAWLALRTLYAGTFSTLPGHIRSATLVDGAGQTVFEFALDRPDLYIADATVALHDPSMVAELGDRLAHGPLTLVLVTDLPEVGVLRTPLAPDPLQTGYRATRCYRRGLLSD